jgi:penicillin-binding protein 1B
MRRFAQLSLIVIGTIAGLAVWAAAGYFVWLNHRMTRELIGEQWKTPTEIYSSVQPDEPFARVYGADWRSTTPVALDEIPDHIAHAFLAAEDIRFHRHFGVDVIGMARALVTNIRAGGIAQGGSTINQQLIKTKFLSADRTWRRKIFEGMLAVVLDLRLTKEQILEAYLNDVYLGHSHGRAVLGVDEASHVYFGKSPDDLTPADAALLGAIIRAPNRDTPERRPEVAKARRNAILDVMHEKGWLDDAAHAEAKKRPATFKRGSVPSSDYPFALAAVRREVISAVGEGAVRRGRLRIVCEIDPDMQREAERAAVRGRTRLRNGYAWIRNATATRPVQVAIVSIDPRDGGIRALIGGTDSFDRTRLMRRQPGSAFKPFVYAAAIGNKEVTPATMLLDQPLTIRLSGGREWQPRNYDERFRGRVTTREALEKSLNIPTIRLSERIGNRRVIRTARDFGFDEDFSDIPALPLGVTEVTPREITAAYTVFPNRGTRVEPFLLTSVSAVNGRSLYRAKPQSAKVIDPATAYVMHSLLRGVVQRGTASRLRGMNLGFVAGKTGTTNDYRDAWFVGYSKDLVTTVWVGFDDGAPLRLSSAEAAIPIWGDYMRRLKLDREELEMPDGVVSRRIDPETGLLWRNGCPGPLEEVFLEGTAPTLPCPTGFTGRIVRRLFYDRESFDEPAAITVEQFQRWTEEIDRTRGGIEGALGRVRRWFGGDRAPTIEDHSEEPDIEQQSSPERPPAARPQRQARQQERKEAQAAEKKSREAEKKARQAERKSAQAEKKRARDAGKRARQAEKNRRRQ